MKAANTHQKLAIVSLLSGENHDTDSPMVTLRRREGSHNQSMSETLVGRPLTPRVIAGRARHGRNHTQREVSVARYVVRGGVDAGVHGYAQTSQRRHATDALTGTLHDLAPPTRARTWCLRINIPSGRNLI